MNWSDVRIFLAVARAGSLGKAAGQLGITQPTAGRRIRALEAALGHTLFQRTSGGFLLTDEGILFRAHAERMEEEALAGARALAGQDQTLTGLLRLSASDWFSCHVLAPLLAEFGALTPGISLELVTDTRLVSLSRREADLAFRITPFTDPDIVTRTLLHTDYALYGREGTPAPKAGDGTGTRLVTMDEAFADMPDAQWLREILPNARPALRSNSRDVQARLCRAGGGLAVLPRPLGDATPGLVRLDLGHQPPGRETYMGYHRDLRGLPRLRALIDHITAALAP